MFKKPSFTLAFSLSISFHSAEKNTIRIIKSKATKTVLKRNMVMMMMMMNSSVIRQQGESQKKQSTSIIPKNEHFLPPDAQMCVFRKIRHVLFSWNPRFEIRPFALLPANSSYGILGRRKCFKALYLAVTSVQDPHHC